MENEKTTTIGVIGGSGLYELFEPGTADEVDVPTPFGPTSSPISIGTMSGRRVAFLTRHGRAHSVAPHRIEHRANLWALRSLGVRAVVSSSAVGGLHPDYAPGTFVVTDQLIDRTWGRADTYFEDEVQHLSFADPFDPVLRRAAIDAVAALDVPFRPTGTCVVIQGPRFSSRAESVWMREAGGHTINMTMTPEVPLAAELGIGTVNLSFVTDADAGLAPVTDETTSTDATTNTEAPVTHQAVMDRLARANEVIVRAIGSIVAAVPEDYTPRELVPASASARVMDLRP
ncbi:5'-methylthioadenosine phosphorylase [Curtobacterium sp. MCJR17_055]|uniref:MTAP family purine nucleoside phosphorylase n=1 Tax=unclassified Curtobacterium TaxID=257496 RepID=UPI000D9855FF|nr:MULTISPECIES: MTAP family purine nucleoside phosphorylase [unclassified Curtobacterium]PYY36803.1 5'-methylthioadenosine phosphorylase [Curtobacterium sp. MCBD17_029]PYY58086.1 5'-methylthioadenosine phosphorylase [Curtobacterium sp. MCPF17_015]PYY58536.1 5'-methylthioadenosine phosphorylase [Curtobacterium sp. MCJR17_055]PZE95156.1 5'-methylthioadenosine phosphorylase [Curtobacterium sp. MCBD17_008]WIB36601.1 MTAP family purine nucleoside phosphorylase [Curtobacterium sp. MCJR17_043]